MRLANRLLATLLAAAVAFAGLLTAAEVFIARVQWPTDAPIVAPYDQWLIELREHTWQEPVVHVVSGATILSGLLLLLLAACAGTHRIPLSSSRKDVSVSTSRTALARALSIYSKEVEGVSSVTAKIRRRRVRVSAQSRGGDKAVVADQLRTHLTERLAALPAKRRPRLIVRVHEPGSNHDHSN